MNFIRTTSALVFLGAFLAFFPGMGSEVQAQSSYFASRGCTSCHTTPVVATCNGCHYHGNRSLAAATNKTSYAPGEAVTVTLTSSSTRGGWIKAILYNQNNVQIAASSGTASGFGGATTFPAALTAPAPTTPGTYTWRMAYFGNSANTGSTHGEVAVSTNSFTVTAPADTTLPVVNTFVLPATSTSLTVPVTSFTASDNVAVTGYLINQSATAPAAAATGWTASVPTSVTATAGSNTFYAWAKDAAGNVSLSRSASVTVTITQADTTAPVVSAFVLPAFATNLTIPVSTFTATDNVGVTGYMVNKSATAPAASAAGWAATAPTSVTAVAGSNTFYAWAKDAAGNVSLSRSASVTVTITQADTTKPTLTISALANGTYTNNATLNISGNAIDAGGLQSVTVNGQTVVVNAAGSFSAALPLMVGANTVTVVATDMAGNQQSDVRVITYDPTAPILVISAPADNSSSAQSFVTLTGTINETSTVQVTDNSGNQQAASISGNNFTATVYLVAGVNTITVAATDLAGNTSSAKRTVNYNSVTMTLAVTYPNQDITTDQSNLVLKGTLVDAIGSVSLTITMNGTTYKPQVTNGSFTQTLTFSQAGTYAITVTATDAAGNRSSIIRNVIYAPATGTSHPFGWTNPKSSHEDYVEKNGVANCTSCHSIDPASKGQPMSCYNCHGKEWNTPSTGTSHPFGWTSPKSSHEDYVEKNGVANCTSCHSIDPASKGQPMSCYNCHGKEWNTPSTGTSHPFGWTNPKGSHANYVEKNGVANCTSCHSTSRTSKGQPMSCYNCHGKEW